MLYLPHPSVDGILKTKFFFFFFFVNATDNGDFLESDFCRSIKN